MAKDPAFLFYPGDWQGGTATMTRFLKGCYMDVLIAQFNNGPLSIEEIRTVLGSDFGQAWPSLLKKFKQTNDGLFFNARLESEKQKRIAYSRSRSENRKKSHDKSYDNTHVNHMSNHVENEDENEDEVKTKKGVTIYGPTSEPGVQITSRYAHDKPCAVHGITGVRELLAANAVTAIYSDDQILSFLRARNGSLFDDGVKHFINALNRHIAKPQTNGNTKPISAGDRKSNHTAALIDAHRRKYSDDAP